MLLFLQACLKKKKSVLHVKPQMVKKAYKKTESKKILLINKIPRGLEFK